MGLGGPLLMVPLLAAVGIVVPQVPPAPPALTPPAASAPAVPLDPAAAVLALGQNDQRMTVPVTIDGSSPYHFVIDTGAERTVIARELADLLQLQAGPKVRMTAITGVSVVPTVEVPMLAVTPLAGSAVTAPALEGRNLGAPGMLGLDSLQDHKIAIDFQKNTMFVQPSRERATEGPSLPNEIVVRARSRFGQLIVTDARYGSRKIKVVIDTGAAVSIGNTAFHHLLANSTRSMQQISIQSVTGDYIVTDYARVDGVHIGGVGLNDLPVAFSDIPPFARFGLSDEPALLLGMDAMRAFRGVTIDFANHEIRFRMRTAPSLQEPDRWSVST